MLAVVWAGQPLSIGRSLCMTDGSAERWESNYTDFPFKETFISFQHVGRHFFQRQQPTNRKQEPSATLVSAAVLLAQAPAPNACITSARARCAVIAYSAKSEPRIFKTSTKRLTTQHVLLCVPVPVWPFIPFSLFGRPTLGAAEAFTYL